MNHDWEDESYCKECGKWVEELCDDSECGYCPNKPRKLAEYIEKTDA